MQNRVQWWLLGSLWVSLVLGGCAPEHGNRTPASAGTSRPLTLVEAQAQRLPNGDLQLHWEAPEAADVAGVRVEWFGSGVENAGTQWVKAPQSQVRLPGLDPQELYTFNLYVQAATGQESAPYTLSGVGGPVVRLVQSPPARSGRPSTASVGAALGDEEDAIRALRQEQRERLQQATSREERQALRKEYRKKIKALRQQQRGASPRSRLLASERQQLRQARQAQLREAASPEERRAIRREFRQKLREARNRSRARSELQGT